MKRKALFIGGTGTISTSITAKLAAEGEWELTLLNRGNRSAQVPATVKVLKADINDEAAVLKKTKGIMFDSVCEFIGFVPSQVERDWRLFRGRTKQYMYISSASAYQKPLTSPVITEGTPLVNPYWQYSRDKIACEDFLMGNVDDGIVREDIRDQFKCCNVYAKEKCKKCFAKFYCSGGCAANSYNFHGNINDAYDVGCELERKRVECAIALKAVQMMEEDEEN